MEHTNLHHQIEDCVKKMEIHRKQRDLAQEMDNEKMTKKTEETKFARKKEKPLTKEDIIFEDQGF